MRTTRSCCTAAISSKKARMRSCSNATTGMRGNGSTSNWRQASMPAETAVAPGLPAEPKERRRTLGDAASLLLRAAAPERAHLVWGVFWLLVAAGMEALGPLIAKTFIDRFLLPHTASVPAIAGLLFGALVA